MPARISGSRVEKKPSAAWSSSTHASVVMSPLPMSSASARRMPSVISGCCQLTMAGWGFTHSSNCGDVVVLDKNGVEKPQAMIDDAARSGSQLFKPA